MPPILSLQQLTEIPHIIFQTTHYTNLSMIPSKVSQAFEIYAKDYERIIFTDEDCIAFLQTFYTPVVVKTFHA